MAQLASNLSKFEDCQVTYLTTKDAVQPQASESLSVLHHQGYHDYQRQVLNLAPSCSDVILGAAVANLVPVNPWSGKFPSHDYQEGDIVNIPFMVAPRIITQVKKVAPHVNLFGFKLLSNVPEAELIHAAYGVLLDSHAAAVIANDASNLLVKKVVTRERAVHVFEEGAQLEAFLWQLMNDDFYKTQVQDARASSLQGEELLHLATRIHAAKPGLFVKTPEGLVLGTVAQRHPLRGFWTTGRGKHELEDAVFVQKVDHAQRVVHSEKRKATLNAPLLDQVFKKVPSAQTIVHGHVQDPELPTLKYAQPGTVRDSMREIRGSFNIENHGCFILLDEQGCRLDGSGAVLQERFL